jgi:hypothetical protein
MQLIGMKSSILGLQALDFDGLIRFLHWLTGAFIFVTLMAHFDGAERVDNEIVA